VPASTEITPVTSLGNKALTQELGGSSVRAMKRTKLRQHKNISLSVADLQAVLGGLKAVDGGTIKAEVVEEPVGPDNIGRR
jgi:hypothetical protein